LASANPFASLKMTKLYVALEAPLHPNAEMLAPFGSGSGQALNVVPFPVILRYIVTVKSQRQRQRAGAPALHEPRLLPNCGVGRASPVGQPRAAVPT
jgi:hypothetical protein